MRFEFICALILSVVVATFAGDKAAAPSDEKKDDGRLFVYSGTGVTFTTFTLVRSTVTTTSTFISTTTCTTSTSALTTCTAGRRRRGLFYDESSSRARRGLFYNDDEIENKDGSAFLPVASKTADPVEEVPAKSVDDSSVIPLEIQSGYNLPEGAPANRFLLAFGTITVTSVTVTTTTATLTAVCSSTTGFFLCGSGK